MARAVSHERASRKSPAAAAPTETLVAFAPRGAPRSGLADAIRSTAGTVPQAKVLVPPARREYIRRGGLYGHLGREGLKVHVETRLDGTLVAWAERPAERRERHG